MGPKKSCKFPAKFPSETQKLTDELVQQRREKFLSYFNFGGGNLGAVARSARHKSRSFLIVTDTSFDSSD